MYLAISSESMMAKGGLYAYGGMWSPGIEAILTQLLYKKNIRGFGWVWGKTKYQLWSYAVPFLYILVIYAIGWVIGFGGFIQGSFTNIVVTSLKVIAFGTVMGCISALGEEIGWSGFFVPQLAKATSFTKTSLLRGIVWSVWHYPLNIWGVYSTVTIPVWYKLISFTVLLTGMSFVFSWLRLKSGSLWTEMFMHASHNLFIQNIFPSLTTDKGMTMYYIGEFGVISAVVVLLVALVFFMKRGQLSH